MGELFPENNIQTLKFQLEAIINHEGTHGAGHYTSLIKLPIFDINLRNEYPNLKNENGYGYGWHLFNCTNFASPILLDENTFLGTLKKSSILANILIYRIIKDDDIGMVALNEMEKKKVEELKSFLKEIMKMMNEKNLI